METDFRATGVVEVQTAYSRRLKASRAAYNLRGPIRIDDIKTAAKLGGSCAVLLMLIHFRRDVMRREAVTLPTDFLAEFGVDKSAKQRGLKRLEEARLVNVKRAAGHTAEIQLRAKKQKARGR